MAKTTVFFAVAVGRENPPLGAIPGKGGGVFLSNYGRAGILEALGLSSSESYPKRPPFLALVFAPITGSDGG